MELEEQSGIDTWRELQKGVRFCYGGGACQLQGGAFLESKPLEIVVTERGRKKEKKLLLQRLLEERLLQRRGEFLGGAFGEEQRIV